MKKNLTIPEVPIEIALHVSRMINISEESLSKRSIIEGLSEIANKQYLERAIKLSLELGMIETGQEGTVKGTEKFSEDFRKTGINDFPLLGRKALQSFAPFLSYIQNIRSGYSSEQSAIMVAGIFGMRKTAAKKFFKKSGLFCNIIKDEAGKITVIESDSKNIDYVNNLKNSLTNDFEAKNFITSILSPEIVSYFTSHGVDFNRPAEALVEIKKDPKSSLYKIFEFAETCLYQLGDDLGASVKTANGLSELVNAIRSQKGILKNPTNLGVGLGSLRNMTNHGPDKETGKTWKITEETSLGTSLLVLRFIRSAYLQSKQKIQEI